MNQPYGQLREIMTYTLYPKGHPYHHSVIGSMNDLNAASLDDVNGIGGHHNPIGANRTPFQNQQLGYFHRTPVG